jgi:hypothetical protein
MNKEDNRQDRSVFLHANGKGFGAVGSMLRRKTCMEFVAIEEKEILI